MTTREADAAPQQIMAAEYVRMSTESQRYSIDHQMLAIRSFAEARDIQIVRTYSDWGKAVLV